MEEVSTEPQAVCWRSGLECRDSVPAAKCGAEWKEWGEEREECVRGEKHR